MNIRKQKAGVAAERKRKAEGARMAREGEVKARAVSIGKLKQYNQKMCEACGLIKQPCYGLASEGKKRWCLGCGLFTLPLPVCLPLPCASARQRARKKAGVAAERKRKAEGARMAREGEVKARKDAAAAAKTEKQQRDVVATARKQEGVVSDDMGEVPLAEWELVEGEAWEEEVKAEPAPALEPTIKRETSDSRRQQLQQQKPICVRSAKRRAVWAARVGIGPKQEKPKKANRRVKIQSRMQQQRQELESCAPCAAAGVATDGMGTVPANKTDQAIFLEPLPKLPPKPRVGKDIEKNARRMATWQRERGEVGLAREERKRVAANYKCMSKKQRFEFIAEPARLPKAAVIQGCGITWRSCVAATRRWCAGCGVVEEVVHL